MLEREPRAERPRAILNVVPPMNRGGIEVSLMHILRRIDRARYRLDFATVRASPGAHDEEIRALGSRVIPCPASPTIWGFARRFVRILRERGPYDIVHSHVHFYGGLVLFLAAREGVPVRIAHSRNDTRAAEAERRWPRPLYVRWMKRWIERYSTTRLAVSRSAAEDLFGPGWRQDPGFRMVYSGRDFGAYAQAAPRTPVRSALGLPADAFVLGHVGRFDWRKNHRHVIAVANELFGRVPNARLLLIGDGPDQGAIEALARSLGIIDRVVFAGARSDVPRLLTGAMDAFIFPSHHEGLGLAAVEAQAAGLPCVLSDTLPEEIDVVPELIHRLSLSAPATQWASLLLDLARRPRPPTERALAAVSQSDFAVGKSLERLLQVYDGAV